MGEVINNVTLAQLLKQLKSAGVKISPKERQALKTKYPQWWPLIEEALDA